MHQLIPRWQVEIHWEQSSEPQTLWLHDSHLTNILQQLSSMTFSKTAQPTKIVISLDSDQLPYHIGTTTTISNFPPADSTYFNT